MSETWYDIGDAPRFSASFAVGDVPTDPATITAKVRDPDGTITTYVHGTDAELERDAEGEYALVVPLTKDGVWFVRFEGTGNQADAATEDYVYVRASMFTASGD